jgi:uncharacterized OsmC-like protein
MYAVTLDDTAEILVKTKAKSMRFALDSSGMNPLEGLYATLAGCAAVFAKKACQELGLSAEGIEISCRPAAGKSGAMSLGRFVTDVVFPNHFSDLQIEHILKSVQHCAVKEVVRDGANVEFLVNALRKN